MNYQKEQINEKEKARVEEIRQKLDKGLEKDGFFFIKMKNEEEIRGKKYNIEYAENEAYIIITSLDKSTKIIIKVKDILYAF